MSYGDELAWIHHSGFSDFAREAAPGVIGVLNRHGVRSVVEIGCGSGVLARELTRAGLHVAGFDASAAMIALARSAVPDARFEVAAFETADLPRCDAVVAMGEVLNHGDARAFFPRAAAALPQDGVFLFDVAERCAYPRHREHRAGGDDWAAIMVEDSDGTTVTRRVLTFREAGGKTQRGDEVHTLELYAREELLALLHDHFRVRVLRSYGGVRLPAGHAVFVCARR